MLSNFANALEALPAIPAPRRAALDAFLKFGLPTTDEEQWKYTDLSALHQLAPGSIAPSAENHEFPAEYDCGLDALNTAMAGGRQTQVLQGRMDLDMGQHRRLRLKVSGEAELILRDDSPSPFAMCFIAIELAPNARLRLLRFQTASAQAQRITRLKIHVARDARLEAVTVDLGGGLVRHDLDVTLDEPGAAVELHGLYAPTGNTHVDNHTHIAHRAPHCQSREFYRGVVGESARAVFNGKIVVHEGARKTDSEQRVANLLLSPKAEVNAKPELEIYNDDVKCAHGATFGQLDETAVFYLRSRGLPADVARSLLTWTFAYEILQKIPQEDLRKTAQDAFIARLPNGALLRDLL